MIKPNNSSDQPCASRLFLQQFVGSIASALSLALLIMSSSASAFGQAEANRNKHSRVGLGKVLSSAHGGQIFDFAVDQSGTDGMIDDAVSESNGGLDSYVETFDISTAKITKVVKKLVSSNGDQELVVRGIGANDVGLVDEERVYFNNGHVTRNDLFYLLNPVSGEKIDGSWTLPDDKHSLFWQMAPNQTTAEQVVVAFREGTNAVPWLYVTDLATNKILGSIELVSFEDDYLLQVAQDTTTNQAVTFINSYPGGPPPVNVVINLKSKKIRKFNGFNNGFYGAGMIDGLAVDSTTGIFCTTTNLNSQVEFYKISDGSGTWAQLPGTSDTDEENSGAAVANDPLHHLFLVMQPYSSTGGSSTVYVYDEKANLEETINGFNFPNADSLGVNIVVNPSLRIGYVNGPNANQLQQFFY